jgi:carboxyl-terminal processing protease
MNRIFLATLILSIFSLDCQRFVMAPDDEKDYFEENLGDFEETWGFLDSTFPFFEFMALDWDSIYTAYRPLAERAKGDEIYTVLMDLLSELRDGHTLLYVEGGGVPMFAYVPPRMEEDVGAYSPYVVRSYFDKELRVCGANKMEYEILDENIGYVYLSNFDSDAIQDFDGVLEYLRDTRGLIIDVRQNGGGYSEQVYFVTGRFITSNMTEIWYDKNGESTEKMIYPRLWTYQKPIVILINGQSISGGEDFPALMQALPNVTVVGDTTAGMGGLTEDFTLSSGKRITTTCKYNMLDGNLIQWNGVPPDILVEQTRDDIDRGRDQQLECGIQLLK